MKIRLFVTGGTIDKQYNELTGKLDLVRTCIPDMLAQGKCRLDIAIESLLLKDSLDMVEEDRLLIAEKCSQCDESRIIITHGTDTMPETAGVLGKGISNKTIVLLGAMIPYTVENSDALFNLGCAVTAVQALPEGVYITMNGKIFTWDNVRKNKNAGVFETKK